MPNPSVVTFGLLLALAGCEGAFKPNEPVPDPGQLRVQISGAIAYQGTWSGFGEYHDVLAQDTAEVSFLGGQAVEGTVPMDLTIVFPGRLDVGTFEIDRFVFGRPAKPGALVNIDTATFVSLAGGTLTVARADYPPRPGLDFGLLRGTMTFRAVCLNAAAADTITVSAQFNAHWYHYLSSHVAVTVTGGGPVLGTSLFALGQSVDDDHGGRFVSWEADLDGAPGQGFPYEISEEFRLAAPAVGMYTLGNMTPSSYKTPAQWPAAFAALYYRDDPRVALSSGGTLTVTRFVAPTDAYYGEIFGTLESPLAVWTDSATVSTDTAHVSATFAIQLWPLGGIPASAMARAGIVPPAAPSARSAPHAPARAPVRRKA